MTKARDIASAIPAPSTVSSAELGYLDGVTSAIQTQIDAKAPSSTAVTLTGTQTLTNKTLTNPVIASVINNTLTTTTGDMIYASAANTPARLGIGSSAQVLTVAGGVPSWAAAGGGSMTLLSTTTLSGTSTTISSIDQTYESLYVLITGVTNSTNDADFNCLPNNVNNLCSYGGFDQGSIFGSIYTEPIRLTGYNVEYKRSDANNVWTIRFDNYASTTAMKPFTANSSFIEPSYSTTRAVFLAGTFRSNTAISSLVFDVEGETFSTGTVKIYGVK